MYFFFTFSLETEIQLAYKGEQELIRRVTQQRKTLLPVAVDKKRLHLSTKIHVHIRDHATKVALGKKHAGNNLSVQT